MITHREVRGDVENVGRPVHAARRVRVGQPDVVVVDAHVLTVDPAFERVDTQQGRGVSKLFLCPTKGCPALSSDRNARLDGRVGDGSQNLFAHPNMHRQLSRPAMQPHTGHAVLDLFPHFLVRVAPFLQDARLERKLVVGRVLVPRVDPAVADQDALEAGGESRRFEDRLRDVGDVLTRVRFAGEVGLRSDTVSGTDGVSACSWAAWPGSIARKGALDLRRERRTRERSCRISRGTRQRGLRPGRWQKSDQNSATMPRCAEHDKVPLEQRERGNAPRASRASTHWSTCTSIRFRRAGQLFCRQDDCRSVDGSFWKTCLSQAFFR